MDAPTPAVLPITHFAAYFRYLDLVRALEHTQRDARK